MGATYLKLEQYSESLTYNQTSLEIFREIGGREGEAEALKNLAELHHRTGRLDQAREFCGQALELATELGIPLIKECEALQLKIENEREESKTSEV
jgi:tetratricopeptide (TPR) repeat protein